MKTLIKQYNAFAELCAADETHLRSTYVSTHMDSKEEAEAFLQDVAETDACFESGRIEEFYITREEKERLKNMPALQASDLDTEKDE